MPRAISWGTEFLSGTLGGDEGMGMVRGRGRGRGSRRVRVRASIIG